MRNARCDMLRRKLLLFALAGMLAAPAPSLAQGFNGRARTYVSYIQARGLVLDSLPTTEVSGLGTQRTLPDGTRASCGVDFCRFYTSGDDFGVIPLLQDVELNVWTGVTGLRAYAHVRAREPLGDREIWPRSDKQFEALAAYVEYGRSFYRIQARRIWQTSNLGFYNYDGASATLRLPSRLDLQVYGGMSLVRGLNQSHRTDLISSVEPLEPQEDAYLGGIYARWRPFPAISASVTYQQERMVHQDDLYSERLAATARLLVAKATVDAEIKYNLATEETNLARLSVSTPLFAGLRGSGEIRKYVPFFELWTIWGAFSPVGYEEARGRLDWTSSTGWLSGYAYGSYREYGETDAQAPEEYSITDHGWRLGAGGRVVLDENLLLSGEYRYDKGYGASRSGGDFSVRRSFGRETYLAFTGTAFETFSEFRVGYGRVYGGGLQGAAPVGPATVQAGAMFYKHDQQDRPSLLDLNQARLHLILEIPIGKDPGLSGRGNQ
jgi:hypothetical protein